MAIKHKLRLRGDTLIEVMFAVGVFGLVAIGAIGIMNTGLYNAQKTLEVTMARNEIDAQAESLRFIHEAYISERNTVSKPYTKLWRQLTDSDNAYKPSDLPEGFFTSYNGASCDSIYGGDAFPEKSFIINVRRLDNSLVSAENACDRGATGDCAINQNSTPPLAPLEQTPTYPRLIFGPLAQTEESTVNLSDNDLSTPYYHDLQKAQGIWVTAVSAETTGADTPEYYDFYIRTCWNSPGSNEPNTISTTIRLSNPDSVQHSEQ